VYNSFISHKQMDLGMFSRTGILVITGMQIKVETRRLWDIVVLVTQTFQTMELF
jgi:hypothetical protein